MGLENLLKDLKVSPYIFSNNTRQATPAYMTAIMKQVFKYNETVRKGLLPSLDIFKSLLQEAKGEKQMKLVLERMHYMGYRKDPSYIYGQLRLTKDLKYLGELKIPNIEAINDILKSISNQTIEIFECVYRELLKLHDPNETTFQILIHYYVKKGKLDCCLDLYRVMQGRKGSLPVPPIVCIPSHGTNELIVQALSKIPDPQFQLRYLMEFHQTSPLTRELFDIVAKCRAFRSPIYYKSKISPRIYATDLFDLMEQLGIEPQEPVYTAIVLSYLRAGNITRATEWMHKAEIQGLMLSADVKKGLFRHFLKQKDLKNCLLIYNEMNSRSEVPESVIVDLACYLVQTNGAEISALTREEIDLRVTTLWKQYQVHRKSRFPRPVRLYDSLIVYYTERMAMGSALEILTCAVEDLVLPSTPILRRLFIQYSKLKGEDKLRNLISKLCEIVEPKRQIKEPRLQVWNVDGLFEEQLFVTEQKELDRASEFPSKFKVRIQIAAEQTKHC